MNGPVVKAKSLSGFLLMDHSCPWSCHSLAFALISPMKVTHWPLVRSSILAKCLPCKSRPKLIVVIYFQMIFLHLHWYEKLIYRCFRFHCKLLCCRYWRLWAFIILNVAETKLSLRETNASQVAKIEQLASPDGPLLLTGFVVVLPLVTMIACGETRNTKSMMN